jgi:hypothetical protein
MTIQEKTTYLQEFAKKHGIEFKTTGEIGIGRECVGFLKQNSYIAYNPTTYPDWERIEEYYSELHYELSAPNAYHKDDYIAVLITDECNEEQAITELYDWVKKLEEYNVKFVEYSTGATGLQAMFSGITNFCAVIEKN